MIRHHNVVCISNKNVVHVALKTLEILIIKISTITFEQVFKAKSMKNYHTESAIHVRDRGSKAALTCVAQLGMEDISEQLKESVSPVYE